MRTGLATGAAAIAVALLATMLAAPAAARPGEQPSQGVRAQPGKQLTAIKPSSSDSPAAARRGGLTQDWTVSEPYSSYRMAWVEEFNLCLGVWIEGEIRATLSRSGSPAGVYTRLHHPRVVDPYMLVTTKRSCDDSSEPKRRHRANTVSYRSYFYGYTCSYNPNFSVGLPWSVGVGATPDCGEERVARLGDAQANARRAYRFELATDGYAFGWDDADGGMAPAPQKICTSASGYFVLRDTAGAERAKAMRRVGFSDPCVYSSSERI